jgi:hypothetical protein
VVVYSDAFLEIYVATFDERFHGYRQKKKKSFIIGRKESGERNSFKSILK